MRLITLFQFGSGARWSGPKRPKTTPLMSHSKKPKTKKNFFSLQAQRLPNLLRVWTAL